MVKSKIYYIRRDVIPIFYALTDIGKKRLANEDFFAVKEFNNNCSIYMVLDGIGGSKSGNVASSKTAERIINYLQNADNINIDIVKNAILEANKYIYDMSSTSDEYTGMGTTLVMLYKDDTGIYVLNIGDSRAYKITKTKFSQVSEDDTYVNALVKDKIITKEEALVHPDRHVLLKAIGVAKEVSPNIIKESSKEFLLCTDGLTVATKEEDIYSVIKNNNPEDICPLLIKLANDNGGQDNITVMYVKF